MLLPLRIVLQHYFTVSLSAGLWSDVYQKEQKGITLRIMCRT
jgi:hypothetical protein